MAFQPEVAQWDAGVYQFETTDVVEGGLGGVDNAPLLNLANRTLYLKTFIERLLAPIISGKGWVLFDDIVSNIPTGWAEVVDMRGKFPAGQNMVDGTMAAIGQNGGAKVKSIGVINLPPHSHKIFVPDDGGQTGVDLTANDYVARRGSSGGDNDYRMMKPTNFNAPTVGKSELVGGGQVMDVMNPYRIVLYIKWVGP